MIYPLTYCEFEKLFSLSFRYWLRTLQQIFLFIIIFIIARAALTYLPSFGVILDTGLVIIMTALLFLLFSLALYRTDAFLRGQSVTILNSWLSVSQHILKVFAAGCILIIAIIVIFFLAKWIMFSLFKLSGITASLITALLGGIPVFLGLIFFYLTIPLIVVDKESLWMAFYRSADLTQQKWFHVFALYSTMVIIVIFLMPQSRHAHWLVAHHLMELFDLIVLSLLLPILINLTLFILRNFQIKEERG